MRLASVLVSSPTFTARQSNKAQGEIVTKNGTESGSAGIMRNPYTFSQSQFIAPPPLLI